MQNARHRFLAAAFVIASFLISGIGLSQANAHALENAGSFAARDAAGISTFASDGGETGTVHIGSNRDFGKGPAGH